MDTEKASHWSQILVVIPTFFSAYLAYVGARAGNAPAGRSMSPTLLWIAFGALLAIGTLWTVLWIVSLRTRARSPKPTALRVLERYYVSLAGLRQEIDQRVWLAKETGKDAGLMQIETAIEKIRAELMNMAPDIIPVATALDFQKPPATTGYEDVSERLPKTVDQLLKKVHSHWSRYAEKSGIEPMRFADTPLVKLHD